MTTHADHLANIGRRNLAALYVFTATSRLWFDGGLWVIYWHQKGITFFEIGLLEALLHVVAVVSDIPAGIFADRCGWKTSLACGTLFGVTYTVLSLTANDIWLIAVAFVSRGLQMTFTNGSDSSIAYESARWAGVQDRYLAISGRLFAIALVSMGVAEAAGGMLAHWSWLAMYVAYTVANVLSLIAVLWIREPRDSAAEAAKRRPSVLTITYEALHFAKRRPDYVRWLVLSGTTAGVLATFAFYGQPLLVHAGWSLVGLGILTGIENGVGAIASLMSTPIVRCFGEARSVAAAGCLASVGLISFAWLPGLAAGLGFLFDSIAGNLMDPIVDQGLNRIVPTEQRATLLSVNSTAFSVFMILGFPLFGAFAQYFGLEHTAYVGSIIGAAAVLVATSWWGRGRKRAGEWHRCE